jgi:hypothetical protein
MARKRAAGDDGGKRKAISKHRFNFVVWMTLNWPFLLLAGIFLPLNIGLLFIPFAPGEEWSRILMFGFLALVVAFIGWIFWRFLRSPTDVRVYAESLRWRRLGQEFDYPWDDVREVYRSERLINRNYRVAELKLVYEDGEKARFNNSLADYDRFADLVQQITGERLLRAARADLDDSGAAFGPVEVTRDGLTINDEHFAWDKVKKVAIVNGHIGCRVGKREQFVRLEAVPNYQVLFTLLGELGRRPMQQRMWNE